MGRSQVLQAQNILETPPHPFLQHLAQLIHPIKCRQHRLERVRMKTKGLCSLFGTSKEISVSLLFKAKFAGIQLGWLPWASRKYLQPGFKAHISSRVPFSPCRDIGDIHVPYPSLPSKIGSFVRMNFITALYQSAALWWCMQELKNGFIGVRTSLIFR